ncbi:MAG: MFS transporter [Phycisphaerales bacterium]|nr:MFS transporter [Phycisphaerales bacterium]
MRGDTAERREAAAQGSEHAGLSAHVRRGVASFLPSALPLLSRRQYALELRITAMLAFMLAGVEAGVAGVIVKHGYHALVERGELSERALNLAVALVSSATAIANITSFVWVRLAHGMDKVAFVNRMLVSMAGCVALLALVPKDDVHLLGARVSGATGLWVFVSLIMLARMIWAGYISIRSTIWRANYERDIRARVTGRFATVQVQCIALLALGMGVAMEASPDSFRILLPTGALFGLFAAWKYRSMRVRGHRKLLADEKGDDASAQPTLSPLSMVRLLAQDRMFAGYMACMFTIGMGNLMVTPLLTIVLKDRFNYDYLPSMLLTQSLPLLMMPLAIPYWAARLGKKHVIEFRTLHCWLFAVVSCTLLIASVTGATWLLYVAAIVQGFAWAGGVLAWNLGHLDFAPPHRATQYMGVHVTLTGVRGILSPVLGVLVYNALEASAPGRGGWVFAMSLGLILASAIGFQVLGRAFQKARAEGRIAAHPGEGAPAPDQPRTTPVEPVAPSRNQ